MAKLLVVEDSQVITSVITKYLEAAGHQVDSASDGQQGFQKAMDGAYDLVLMDLMMPGWDGYQAIGSLELARPETRVLVVSAKLDAEAIKKLAGHKNIVGQVRKPFTRNELTARIDKILG